MKQLGNMSTQVLLDFCNSLCINEASIKNAESLRRYHLREELSDEGKQNLSADLLRTLVEDFKDALALRLGIEGYPRIDIDDASLPETLEDDVQALREAKAPIVLDLEIDKAALLEEYELDDEAHQALIYLFKQNLIDRLDKSVLSVDKIWDDTFRPVLFLILDTECLYTGIWLTISGPQDLAEAIESISIRESDKRRIDSCIQEAKQNLSHVDFTLHHLTPVHVMCKQHHDSDPKICTILRRHLFHLAILYSANRTINEKDVLKAHYSSAEQTFVLSLQDEFIADKDDRLVRFARWPYIGHRADRLTVLQNVIAREPQTGDSANNYRSLLERIEYVISEVRWNYRIHITQKIDKHFEQLQSLSSYVSGISQQVSDIVENLSKGLTETFLTAIGAIVASFLAALIKDETQGYLFQLSMKIYAVYIMMLIVIRLGSTYDRYRLLNRDAERELDRYRDLLGKDRVNRLTSPLDRRKRHFCRWLVIVLAIYLILMALAWLASSWVPHLLASQDLMSPLPTPTTPLPPSTP